MTQTGTPGRNPMRAPDHGVTIRMYRLGHGDCFLLCFRRSQNDDKPFFLLIDCGKKGGSHIHADVDTEEVIEDIANATGGTIDLAVVTHEHEDHVSGFPYGDSDDDHPVNRLLKIERLWLAWTEDPSDDEANRLRDDYEDTLIVLAMATAEMNRLDLSGASQDMVRELFELESGGQAPDEFLEQTARRLGVSPAALTARTGQSGTALAFANVLAIDKPKGFKYKMRLAGLRHHVGENKIDYLDPRDGEAKALPGVDGVKVYPLGPPRDEKLLKSLNPRRDEEFKLASRRMGAAFDGAAGAPGGASPFAPRHILPQEPILDRDFAPDTDDAEPHAWLVDRYMGEALPEDPILARRRITGEWLDQAEALALRINDEVNNTSLVLLFELPGTSKTLLFTGDAQRGSWISWADLTFDGQSARDLLGRCVFYKVGHHGSHNATLKGEEDSEHPNLDWLALGDRAEEFTAMIPSNKKWAWGKSRPWKHPLPAIEAALIDKAKGRVMITSDLSLQVPPPWDGAAHTKLIEDHKARTKYRKRYIEHWVPDR